MKEFDDSTDIQELTIYGNLLINDEIRLEIFKSTLPGWLIYWKAPCLLRIRGRFAKEAIMFTKDFSQVKSVQDSDFLTWRKQSEWDIRELTTPFVIIYLEDHMIKESSVTSSNHMSEIRENRADVFQYSWFHQYSQLRKILLDNGAESTQNGVFIELTKSLVKRISQPDRNYFVSLSSIFSREFLLKVLGSPKPLIRRYDPRSPFDVEQRPGTYWYLPIIYGVASNEIIMCIDDDNGVTGSSAISLGLYEGPVTTRGLSHHAKNSLYLIVLSLFHKLKVLGFLKISNAATKSILFKGLSYLNVVTYSLEAPTLRLIDFLIECVYKLSRLSTWKKWGRY